MLQAFGVTEGVGYSDPHGVQRKSTEADIEEHGDHEEHVPAHYTLEAAQA